MRVSYSAIACLALATGALALPAPLESPNPSFNLAMANAYRTIPSQPDAHIKDEGVGQAVELLSGELEGRRATGEQGGQLQCVLPSSFLHPGLTYSVSSVVGPSLEKRQLAAIIGILGLTAAEEAAASSSNGGSGSWEWDATDARNLGIALGCILGVPLLVGLTCPLFVHARLHTGLSVSLSPADGPLYLSSPGITCPNYKLTLTSDGHAHDVDLVVFRPPSSTSSPGAKLVEDRRVRLVTYVKPGTYAWTPDELQPGEVFEVRVSDTWGNWAATAQRRAEAGVSGKGGCNGEDEMATGGQAVEGKPPTTEHDRNAFSATVATRAVRDEPDTQEGSRFFGLLEHFAPVLRGRAPPARQAPAVDERDEL
ncbi:hypothetical protein JCM8097_000400 [Rhodosporidiobolus ruineniae]